LAVGGIDQKQYPHQRQRAGAPAPHIQLHTFKSTRKRPRSFLNVAFVLCRQLPTLPHTFACSTIGPAGLNFRVRDGNGWNPRGKITDKSEPSAISRQHSVTRTALTLWLMRGKLVIAIKEREDEASQLNRLGETGLAPSLLQCDFFVGASRQYCVFSRVQFLTLLRRPSAFEQVRTES
jgi:hypothetical protein